MLAQTITFNTNNFSAHVTKQRKKSSKQFKWDCKLPETVISSVLAVPLTSIKMLNEENQHLENSFMEYVFRCHQQQYSIYSLRTLSGLRIASLGLIKENGHWYVDKCIGLSGENVLEETLKCLDDDDQVQEETVPTELYYIAQEIARLMNYNKACN